MNPSEEELGGWHEIEGGLELRSIEGARLTQVRWSTVAGFRIESDGIRLDREDGSDVTIFAGEPRYVELVQLAMRQLGLPSPSRRAPMRWLRATGPGSEFVRLDYVKLRAFAQVPSTLSLLIWPGVLRLSLKAASVPGNIAMGYSIALLAAILIWRLIWRRRVEVRTTGISVRDYPRASKYDFADIADVRERWWGHVEFEFTDGRVVRTSRNVHLLQIVRGHMRRLDKSKALEL